MKNKLFYILSIDGGGIRGIFAAHILKRIEEELKIKFSQQFDIITGTSTGSIIAAGLAIDYPIKKIVDLYKSKGKDIFYHNYSEKNNWFNWKVLFQSKYNNQNLKKELFKVFKEKTMSDTKTRLIIPATDISNGNVFVIKSNYDPDFVRDKDIRMTDAILASCSAPTFFNPHFIEKYLLADGGLWANNPSLLALTEAMGKRIKIPKENIKILSIGTGKGREYYNIEDLNKKWGLIKWGPRLVNVIMNLQSVNVDNVVKLLLGEEKYFRINYEAGKGIALDDLSSVENLIAKADEKFNYHFNKIKKFLVEANYV